MVVKKIKIYLAKSNRSNPTTVSRVRTFLSNNKSVSSLAEFTGGHYTNDALLGSDFVVFITEPESPWIGKGLYGQIRDCKSNNIPFVLIYTSSTKYYIIGEDALRTETLNEDDYVHHVKINFSTKHRDVESFGQLDDSLIRCIGPTIEHYCKDKAEEAFFNKIEEKKADEGFEYVYPLTPKESFKQREDYLLLISSCR